MGGDACVIGSWPSAGAAAPRVKPPANVAPLFRSSRRLKRFEPIGLSFADEPERKSLTRSRKYTPVSAPNRASPECPSSLTVPLVAPSNLAASRRAHERLQDCTEVAGPAAGIHPDRRGDARLGD